MHTHVALERIPLSSVPRRLAAGFDGSVPSYAAVYRATVNAQVPADQSNGRWFVSAAELPTLAIYFGMRPKAVAEQS